MQTSMPLLREKRFGPLFVTQFLNAFNDNFFRTAMVILVIYGVYSDPAKEASFSALAQALFILPFFLFSALAGQLADSRDKAMMIRVIKTAEIVIMIAGGMGLALQSIPLMLIALFAMGVHSAFFGPIKYAILPQHLKSDEVLGGTGLVEAGTYIAILAGTIVGGLVPTMWAAGGIVLVAVIGRISAGFVPQAVPAIDAPVFKMDYNLISSSIRLVNATMHIRRLFLAIISISFFWAIGTILAIQFPPLVKNVLGADEKVATLFMAIFSIGIAIGSVAVNRLLKGEVSARYSPASVIVMGLFVLDLWWAVTHWPANPGGLMTWREFIGFSHADRVLFDLLGIAIAGGMFVVPLYAFLTTTVSKTETARTVAANNIVNSGGMVAAAIILNIFIKWGVTVEDCLLLVAVSCLISAWIAYRLHRACD
ncbi:MAG: MFS transporter [Pseudomonadota bacterium]